MYTGIIKKKKRKFSLEDKILSIKERDYKNAEKYLHKSKEEIKYLGNDFLTGNKIELSIKCGKITAALETDPKKKAYEIYSIGFLYSLLGKINTAKRYYKFAAKNGNIRALNALGIIFCHEGKFSSALSYLEKALKLDYNPALHSLGYLYFKMQKYDLAEKYYKKAIDSEPRNFGEKFYKSSIMCNLGILYEKNCKDELAEKYYKMGIEYNNNSKSMVQLGKFYQMKKQYDLALKYYQMGAGEGHPLAKHLLKELKKSDLLSKTNII